MRKPIIWMALLAVAVAFAGCSSSGTGGVKTGNGATISVMAVSTLPASAFAASAASVRSSSSTPKEDHEGEDADGTTIAVSQVYANIDFIEMELPDGAGCDSFGGYEFAPPVSCNSDKLTIDGPFVVDLGLGTTIPETGDLTIPPGLYKQVKLRFGPSGGVNLPIGHPMIGHSFYADGTYALSGDPVPPTDVRHFTLALDFNVEPQFENPAGIAVTADSVDKVLLTLDVAGWFTSLHIGSCVEDLVTIPDPLVLPSDLTGDCDISDIFKSNVESSGDLKEEGD